MCPTYLFDEVLSLLCAGNNDEDMFRVFDVLLLPSESLMAILFASVLVVAEIVLDI